MKETRTVLLMCQGYMVESICFPCSMPFLWIKITVKNKQVKMLI